MILVVDPPATAGGTDPDPTAISDSWYGPSERTTARFFNTSAFTTAPQFTIGNSSRNPVRGPQYRNADIALIKRTYFGENRNVEFRAEAFNVTNTPPLCAPNTVQGAVGLRFNHFRRRPASSSVWREAEFLISSGKKPKTFANFSPGLTPKAFANFSPG
jgi:hypothetical protein